ncbi:hypothetical protein GY45DRAFT_368495 [Cubamyces sp. BRFM 1775]|nr:hypothetical protein GY45DRAFT_368495 [Cubamyces sp. BRFM 1775]
MMQQRSVQVATPAPETGHSVYKNNAALDARSNWQRNTPSTYNPSKRDSQHQTRRTGEHSVAYTQERTLSDQKAGCMPTTASPLSKATEGARHIAKGMQDVEEFMSISPIPSRQGTATIRDEDTIEQFNAWLETPANTRVVPRDNRGRDAIIVAQTPERNEATPESLSEKQAADLRKKILAATSNNPEGDHAEPQIESGSSMRTPSRRKGNATGGQDAPQGSLGRSSIGPVASWSPVRHDGAAVQHDSSALDRVDLPWSASLPSANARLAQMDPQRAYAASDTVLLSQSTRPERKTTPGRQIYCRKAGSAPPAPTSHGAQSPGSVAHIPQAVRTKVPAASWFSSYGQTLEELEVDLGILAPLADGEQDLQHELEEMRVILRRAAQGAAKLTERSRKLHQLRLAIEQVLFAPAMIASHRSSGSGDCPCQAETNGECAEVPRNGDGQEDDIGNMQDVEMASRNAWSSDQLAGTEGRGVDRPRTADTRKRPADDTDLDDSPRKRARGA